MSKIDILKKSLINAVLGMLLTFPIVVIKVNTIEREITWRWLLMFGVGAVIMVISFLWILQQERQKKGYKI